ncbi:hypothetical protein V6N13_010795 [Hibiscus sabdariffa]
MANATVTASSTLSWLHSFGGTHNEATNVAGRNRVFVVFAQKKAKNTRKIMLKEDVEYLGKKGQLLDVKAGYFRNYLLPMGKAQIITPALLKEMKMEEERIEAEKQRVKEEAQQLALMFETVGAFKVKRKGGKGKQIFGRDVDRRIKSLYWSAICIGLGFQEVQDPGQLQNGAC